VQDDQACAHLYILHSGHDVALDLRQALFTTFMSKACRDYRWVWRPEQLEWAARYVGDSKNQQPTHPLVLHGNGPSKWLLNAMLAERLRLSALQELGQLAAGEVEVDGKSHVFGACCARCRL